MTFFEALNEFEMRFYRKSLNYPVDVFDQSFESFVNSLTLHEFIRQLEYLQ